MSSASCFPAFSLSIDGSSGGANSLALALFYFPTGSRVNTQNSNKKSHILVHGRPGVCIRYQGELCLDSEFVGCWWSSHLFLSNCLSFLDVSSSFSSSQSKPLLFLVINSSEVSLGNDSQKNCFRYGRKIV